MIELQDTPQAGRYAVILADPPWRFVTRSAKGLEKSPEAHYPCMDLEAIAALPVGEVAGPRCWLALWTTWPMLAETLGVVEGWSDPDAPWRYVSGGSWHKKTANGLDGFGTGYTFRSSSEPLLLFKKGDPRWHSKSERNSWATEETWAIEAKLRENSRKPDQVIETLERATRGPRLEIFSRTDREGWDSWGLDAGLFNDPERVATMKARKLAKARAQLELSL